MILFEKKDCWDKKKWKYGYINIEWEENNLVSGFHEGFVGSWCML